MSFSRGPGRPVMDDCDRKTDLLKVRVLAADKALVERAAKMVDVSVSDFVRDAVMARALQTLHDVALGR